MKLAANEKHMALNLMRYVNTVSELVLVVLIVNALHHKKFTF